MLPKQHHSRTPLLFYRIKPDIFITSQTKSSLNSWTKNGNKDLIMLEQCHLLEREVFYILSTNSKNNRKGHQIHSASLHWKNLRQNKIYPWRTNKKERLHNTFLKEKWLIIPRFYCNFTPKIELAIPKLQVLIPTHFKTSWKGGWSLEVLSDNEVQRPETDKVSWKVNIFYSKRNSFKCKLLK